MRPMMQERHFIYVLGPNQDSRLASVAAGQPINNIELRIKPDAPFLMRGRAYRVSYDSASSHTQVGLQNLSLRFSGPDQDFRMNALVPQGLQMAFGGQGGNWKPENPEIAYPKNSIALIDILNTGSTALTNLTLYFLGVELYPWGINPAYTYPKRCALKDFAYPINPADPVNNPTGSIQNLLVTDTRLLQTFQTEPDTDFVFTTGQAGPSYAPFAFEVGIILRDENRKAYSNDYVNFEVLFGPSTGNYQTGAGGVIPGLGMGNALPAVFTPEIYIPANHLLYYDIQRADSAIVGAATIPNFPINLKGSKVFKR